MELSELDTPALVVDLDLMEANIAALMERLRPTGVRVRPHLKTAKCPEVARILVRRARTGKRAPAKGAMITPVSCHLRRSTVGAEPFEE